MKNVSDEVLRQIGTNKDWTKKLRGHLQPGQEPAHAARPGHQLGPAPEPARHEDDLAVDRNVPEVIRKQAQKFVRRRRQPGGEDKH